MVRDLEGKTAVVTGGGRGIGRAISIALAQRGANVVIAYFRRRQDAEETAGVIEGEGVKALVVKCPVGDPAQLDALFDEVGETFGRLDLFVSNAATGVIKPVPELDIRAWDWTLNANARALFLGSLRSRDLMVEGGNIVALTSLGSTRVLPGYSVVGASKAAIESLVRYLAVELAAEGIRVNAVSPGVVDTGALRSFPMRSDMLEFQARAPIPEPITPEDVADAVMFLTSSAASKVTGQTLVVDGGASLPWMDVAQAGGIDLDRA